MYARQCLHLGTNVCKSLVPAGRVNFCQRCKSTAPPSWGREPQTYRRKGLGKYFLLIIPGSALWLGTWQVERRKWKLELIKAMEEKTRAPPVPFPEDLNELESMSYRKVIVKGRFQHNKEMYILPRAPVDDADRENRIGPTVGVHVVTPFTLSDRDLTILVNRGWVPRSRQNPETRQAGQITGEVELVGVVRTSEKRQPFAAENIPEQNQWYYRDISAMAEMVGASPVFLDADRKSTVHNGPIGGQTRINLRNEHLSYIITWYSVAAITGFMWWYRFFR